MSRIKSAVSCYSLQDAYARRRLDLPGILAFIKETGAEGVELISDQMIVGSPRPSAETVAIWRDALETTGLAAVCNSIFINSTIYRNRTLRLPEQVEMLVRELEVSKQLGFDQVRLVSNTSAAVTEAALPEAERLGITMALEIHAAMSFTNPWTIAWIDMMKRVQSERLGLVIDLGIFCHRHPRVSREFWRALGTSPAVLDKIDEIFASEGDTYRVFVEPGTEAHAYPEDLRSLFRSQTDVDYAMFSSSYENTSLDVLDEHIDHITHIHGKFYEMQDDGTEYSIDYPAVLTRLNKLSYDGYIASEYEGNRFILVDAPVPDMDQVRRHQAMLSAHIDDGK